MVDEQPTIRATNVWEIHNLMGEPRLIWLFGGRLVELVATSGVVGSERELPERPELDVLAAMLRFALERVEGELAVPPRLVQARNFAGDVVVDQREPS